jgi:hypothetical protein
MQLPLTADVLTALGAGAVVLVALVVLALVLRRKRSRSDDVPEPSAADWTGENANGDAQAPSQRTVAEVVAGREADTAALPVSPAALLTRPPVDGPEPGRVPGADRPADPAATPAAQAPPVEAPATEPDAHPEAAVGRSTPEAPRPSTDHGGPGRTVAVAVAQAFALRAAAGRAPEQASDTPERAAAVPPAPRGDARDRLLAVLLDDPVRAVGAAMELEACRSQLDRLSDAVRHERGVLGDVLNRLAGAGLRPEQLARLAGMPLGEVHAVLDRSAARTS